MAIKVNFADAFLQSYGPGAQQGAHQWQQMQRQKAQEQQFQIERQDALARFQQKQDLDERQFASLDEYRKGQLAQDQAQVEAEQADVQTAAKGMQSLATGEVPDPRKRIADIAGMFKGRASQDEFVKREGEALTAREKQESRGKLKRSLLEAQANPAIAGDPILADLLGKAALIAEDQDSDPDQLLNSLEGIYGNAGDKQAALGEQANFQSMVDADLGEYEAQADAANRMGDYERGSELRERASAARKAWGRGQVQPEKAGEAYDNFGKTLHPYRNGGTSKKAEKAKEPYSYAEALKLAQGSIDKEDAVRAKKALQAAARKAGKSEEEIDEIEGPTVLELQKQAAREIQAEMNPQPTSQGAPSQAQMRTQPGGMGPGPGPQQMNGQPQAQAPAQAAPVQAPALPPAAFDKRKPEEQQGFISEIEADLRDGGGTNLEAIYQKYGVVPGSIPPAVKARLKRAASGGR